MDTMNPSKEEGGLQQRGPEGMRDLVGRTETWSMWL